MCWPGGSTHTDDLSTIPIAAVGCDWTVNANTHIYIQWLYIHIHTLRERARERGETRTIRRPSHNSRGTHILFSLGPGTHLLRWWWWWGEAEQDIHGADFDLSNRGLEKVEIKKKMGKKRRKIERVTEHVFSTKVHFSLAQIIAISRIISSTECWKDLSNFGCCCFLSPWKKWFLFISI